MFAGLKPDRTRLGPTRPCGSPEANTSTQTAPCTTVLSERVLQTRTGQHPDISSQHEQMRARVAACIDVRGGPTK